MGKLGRPEEGISLARKGLSKLQAEGSHNLSVAATLTVTIGFTLRTLAQ